MRKRVANKQIMIMTPGRRLHDVAITKHLIKHQTRYNRWFNMKLPVPPVIIFNDRRQMKQFWGPQPTWAVGRQYLRTIYILHDKYAKRGRTAWLKIIAHEQAHVYINAVSGGRAPKWLNEGLATVLANQEKKKPTAEQIKDFFQTKPGDYPAEVYIVGNYLVKKLIAKYGRQKLLDYLRKLSNVKSSTAWKTIFPKIFGVRWATFINE